MNSLIKLSAAFLIGIILYVACFTFFVHKPMTVGITFDYFQAKRAYLKKIQYKKKILILAGSNGRFSHRCETIENSIGIPCANLSIAAGMDLFYQLGQYREFLLPGDLLYMPLEYRANGLASGWTVGLEGPMVARYDHKFLRELGLRKVLSSLFYFDVHFLLSGVGEMVLNGAGKKRRFGTYTLTEQGDESGHDRRRSEPYRDYIRSLPTPVIEPEAFGNEQNWGDLLKILTWASDRGVVVVGGLPTTFDEVAIPDQALEAYRQIFISRGHRFLMLENKSQYPRDLFYDTPYHLREEGQIQHSIEVAKGLQKLFTNR